MNRAGFAEGSNASEGGALIRLAGNGEARVT